MDNITTKKELNEALREALLWKERSDKATKKYNEIRQSIALYMESNNMQEVVDEAFEGGSIKAKLVERVTSLKYDTEAMKERFDKEVYNEVVDKTYTIVDIDSLIKLLKKAGVKPSEFKTLIHVDETANKQRIQQLFSVGDITNEQLKGTFTATISKSIQITQEKRE